MSIASLSKANRYELPTAYQNLVKEWGFTCAHAQSGILFRCPVIQIAIPLSCYSDNYSVIPCFSVSRSSSVTKVHLYHGLLQVYWFVPFVQFYVFPQALPSGIKLHSGYKSHTPYSAPEQESQLCSF